MEATAQERKNKSELNQAHLKNGSEKKISHDTDAGPSINPVEVMLILGAAITVDLIDAADLTVFGAILVRFIDVPTLGALWLWRILKHQTGPKKDPTFLILSAFLVEISPIGMLPTWSLFVIYTYFQDTKLGQKTIGKVQKMTKAKKAT